MYTSILNTILFTILLIPLNISAYVITRPDPTLSKRSPANQLAAMLSNPNACPTSTGECVTPADAIGPILNGLYKYGIKTAAEQAAVVSLMAFESVDFQYNHNISPGRPGQGTRAMLMPNFITKYVADLPEVAGDAAGTGGDPVKMLALVQDNTHSFASASWFYATQCTDAVKQQVKTGGAAGWANYISSCVGTTVTDERKAYWLRACQQLGAKTS